MYNTNPSLPRSIVRVYLSLNKSGVILAMVMKIWMDGNGYLGIDSGYSTVRKTIHLAPFYGLKFG